MIGGWVILALPIAGLFIPNVQGGIIVNEVTYGNRVYFTKNGHGTCALVDIAELDDLDKQKALLQLMTKLAEAKVSVREEGTVSADDLEKELGL